MGQTAPLKYLLLTMLPSMQTLEDTYRLVCDRLAASHKRQKKHYDKKVHGKLFNVGNLVCLHSSLVPKGQSKKLHHPWTRPLRVVQRISESDYRIKALGQKKRFHVVHFDRLKLCAPGTRFEKVPRILRSDNR